MGPPQNLRLLPADYRFILASDRFAEPSWLLVDHGPPTERAKSNISQSCLGGAQQGCLAAKPGSVLSCGCQTAGAMVIRIQVPLV